MEPENVTAKKIEDALVIRDILIERGEEASLENARFVLSVGLRNRPDAWALSLEELAEYWALVTENA